MNFIRTQDGSILSVAHITKLYIHGIKLYSSARGVETEIGSYFNAEAATDAMSIILNALKSGAFLVTAPVG